MSKSVAYLDLHAIAKNSRAIDEALENLFADAVEKRLKTAEIISGKGSGQLIQRVKKFLARKDIKILYKRVEIDAKNHGRLFVYFR